MASSNFPLISPPGSTRKERGTTSSIGPLRGIGPGTQLSWRDSMSSAPHLVFTYLSTICEVVYVVPQFAGTAVTPFCFICAFRPGFLSGLAPLAFDFYLVLYKAAVAGDCLEFLPLDRLSS
ncbi:hypothetical protein ElyMa_006169800 [Elysia marginata]|uniref:Uncharacterized protein n=1 Tax=Elysia marginata TaxID=1093978 RepID=A0AAV4GZA0_9GAST|nr:hypothetical protein ElyMa_006169800 [Elysia marginata]